MDQQGAQSVYVCGLVHPMASHYLLDILVAIRLTITLGSVIAWLEVIGNVLRTLFDITPARRYTF